MVINNTSQNVQIGLTIYGVRVCGTSIPQADVDRYTFAKNFFEAYLQLKIPRNLAWQKAVFDVTRIKVNTEYDNFFPPKHPKQHTN